MFSINVPGEFLFYVLLEIRKTCTVVRYGVNSYLNLTSVSELYT